MAATLTPEQVQSRERMSAHMRTAIEEEGERDASKPASETTLWQTIRGFITNINYRYTISTNPIILFEIDMHDIWHEIIVSASVTPADDAAQDRLVAQVLYAREMGTLTRVTTGRFEECVTSDGSKIWTDLPYLVKDFRKFWKETGLKMDAVRRCNLVAFMARLTALGVCDGALSSCALALFKQTFEVQRPLTREEGTTETIPKSELVPACLGWMRYCGHKLLTLTLNNPSFEEVHSADLEPGELARQAGVHQAGFSVDRWIFWRTQFKELCRSGDEGLFADGRCGFGLMIYIGQEIGVKVPGEAEWQKRTTKFLNEKLERTGATKMVSSEDMPMFSDEE